MSRIERLTLEPVVFLPERADMAPGVLYWCDAYGTASHLCACGCGVETVTPLGPDDWILDPAGPTLHPSIGNQKLPCGSHYFLQGGEIRWC